MGFHQSHHEDIKTDYSAMSSKVVQNSIGCIKFSIMQPASGKRKSQIDEYLTYYHGPRVQHTALLSSGIINTVQVLRANGVKFLETPHTYYDVLEDHIDKIDEDIVALCELSILVERDESGYLMQIFTKPVQSRPRVFLKSSSARESAALAAKTLKRSSKQLSENSHCAEICKEKCNVTNSPTSKGRNFPS